jgi:hypothetical protein
MFPQLQWTHVQDRLKHVVVFRRAVDVQSFTILTSDVSQLLSMISFDA